MRAKNIDQLTTIWNEHLRQKLAEMRFWLNENWTVANELVLESYRTEADLIGI